MHAFAVLYCDCFIVFLKCFCVSSLCCCRLVSRYMAGTLPIDHYVTHEFQGIETINDAMHVLHAGKCLRSVVKY